MTGTGIWESPYSSSFLKTITLRQSSSSDPAEDVYDTKIGHMPIVARAADAFIRAQDETRGARKVTIQGGQHAGEALRADGRQHWHTLSLSFGTHNRVSC